MAPNRSIAAAVIAAAAAAPAAAACANERTGSRRDDRPGDQWTSDRRTSSCRFVVYTASVPPDLRTRPLTYRESAPGHGGSGGGDAGKTTIPDREYLTSVKALDKS